MAGRAGQIFSVAEAVGGDNRAIKYKDKPLNWGGATQLWTGESKCEINGPGDCGTRGWCTRRPRGHARSRQS